MKDSKTIRNEHQSFVDAWKKIQEDNSSAPVEEGYKDVKKMLKTPKKGYKVEKVLVRKSGAFTALAEKYDMSPKQFGRYVEANQHLFDISTRKKAILANKFQGFKETEEWDEFFGDLIVEEIPITPHDVNYGTKAGKDFMSGKKNPNTGKPVYKLKPAGGMRIKLAHNELEGEDLQEITTKDTKSGTKFKVRVKDKKTNSSYIRFATRDKIAQLRSDPKIASVEMTDEGQTPEERGDKKAQAAGGGSPKKAKKDYDGDGKVETGSQEYLGSRDKAIKKAMKKRSVTTEGLEGDQEISETTANLQGLPKNMLDSMKVSNTNKSVEQKPEVSTMTKQGKPRTKAQMMAAKRIASGKTIADVKAANTQSMRDRARERHAAFKARRMAKEELSDWREDLKEIMGEVEKTEGKKSKSKKMKNGICINPDTDDEKNKYEEVNAQKVAESLGAELQSLKIEDADGNVAYEVVDLVKPDPIKENVLSEVEGTNMFPKGTQEKVKSILDKGSNFMKNTKVGRVLGRVFGSKNQGSDYGPGGKTPR